MVEQLQREDAQEEARYDATHGRYLSLVAVINGTPPTTNEEDSAVFAWIAAALRASARREDGSGTPETAE